MKPAPEQFLHGERGARVCVVPQAFVSWLYREAGIRELHARHRGADPLIDACLVAMSLAALEAPSEVGSKSAPRSEVLASSPQREITTRVLADQLDITTRAVVQAIHEHRLPARRGLDGRWWIKQQDADRFANGRSETAA